MEELSEIMIAFGVPVGVCVVLPVMIVWLVIRHKSNKTNKNAEIAIAAINANPTLDVEELINKLNPKKAMTLKERLISKLYTGCVFLATGIAVLICMLWLDLFGGTETSDLIVGYLFGLIPLFIGIAMICVYRISKRMHAKELEDCSAESES